MGAKVSVLNEKRVCVVGGGVGGVEIARLLVKQGVRVTLIDKQDSRTHVFATLRAAVVPGWENRSRIPLNQIGADFVQGEVERVESGRVHMKGGRVVECDAVVLAHGGSGFPFPMGGINDKETYIKKLRETQGKIRDSKSVLIIGGGPVGVEMAGEMAAQYPNKKITLVHSGEALLSGAHLPINPRAVRSLTQQLTQVLHVNLKLNTRVDQLPQPEAGSAFAYGEQTVSLSDGSTVTADVIFLAMNNTGLKPQSMTLVDSKFTDERNLIVVDDLLQVEGLEGVFAIGDATNIKETKMGFFAMNQAKVASKNVANFLKGAPLTARYTPMPSGVMLVPLGPRQGAGAFGGSVLGRRMTSAFKGGDLMSKQVFKAASARAPAARA